LGLSLTLLWPAFLTFPFALFQINQMRNISLALPPTGRFSPPPSSLFLDSLHTF